MAYLIDRETEQSKPRCGMFRVPVPARLIRSGGRPERAGNSNMVNAEKIFSLRVGDYKPL